MAAEADGRSVRYHRRLDRTPEKEFERLPDPEKKLMSTMRGALEGCRIKVIGLKEDVEQKEKVIEAERIRRRDAEERLKQVLVDPYPSPNVNSELRHRLPRANKSDPLLDQNDSGTAEGSGEEREDEEEEDVVKSKSSSKSHSNSGVRSQQKRKVRRSLDFQAAADSRSSRSGRDGHDGTSRVDYSSSEEEEETRPRSKPRSKHSRGKDHHPSEYSVPHPPFPPLHHGYYPPGGAGYPHFTSPFYRPGALTPWSSVGSFPSTLGSGEGQATSQATGIPQSRSFPLLNGETVGGLGPTMHFDGGSAKPMHSSAEAGLNSASHLAADPSAAPSASVPGHPSHVNPAPPPGLHSHSASSLSSHYALPAALGGGGGIAGGYRPPPFPSVGLYGAGATVAGSGVGTPFTDLSGRSTIYLHDEIERLKHENKQLAESLASSSQETEMLKLQILAEKPRDASLDSDGAKKFAVMMAEVKASERRRETTLGRRIGQLEHDREELMCDQHRAPPHATGQERTKSRRPTRIDLSESESETEESEEEEAEAMTDRGEKLRSVAAAAEDGRVASLKDALREVERRQQKELQVYREEIQVLMEQRDQALEQLQTTREANQMQQLRMPGQREQMMMAKISTLQTEKERAENLIRRLKEDQVEKDLFNSLHKVLLQDNGLNDNERTAKGGDSKLKAKLGYESEGEDARYRADLNTMKGEKGDKEDNQLLEQLHLANQERSQLQLRCRELEAACGREREEKNRLQRLNGVLQKKLVAISSGTKMAEEE